MNLITGEINKPEPFYIEYLDTYLHGDILHHGNNREYTPPDILFIHDINRSSNRQEFKLVRQYILSKYGITSCAFDCVGHGNTSGNLNDSTLAHRVGQTVDIIDACFDSQSVNIIAIGAGAHTALKILTMRSIEGIMFIDPALFSKNAVHQSIDTLDDASKVGSWEESDLEIHEGLDQCNIMSIVSLPDDGFSSTVSQSIHDLLAMGNDHSLITISHSKDTLIKHLNEDSDSLNTFARSAYHFARLNS